jgi:hypothetical protein
MDTAGANILSPLFRGCPFLGGYATYALRPHPRNYTTFQRKIYLTQRLADIVNFIEDLLAPTSRVEWQQPPLPDLELPEGTATALDAGTEEARGNFERRLSELEKFRLAYI